MRLTLFYSGLVFGKQEGGRINIGQEGAAMAQTGNATPVGGQPGRVVINALHYCPLFRLEIDRTKCWDKTRIPSINVETCSAHKCTSPWRLCHSCLLQGHRLDDAHVVDAAEGLCGFHKEKGKEANRRDQTSSSRGEVHAGLQPRVALLVARGGRPQSSGNGKGVEGMQTTKPAAPVAPVAPRRERAASEGQKILDIAREIENMLGQKGGSVAKVAAHFRHSTVWVADMRRLLKLHPDIEVKLQKGDLTQSIASRLAALHPDQQMDVLREVTARGLKQTEAIAYIRNVAGTARGTHKDESPARKATHPTKPKQKLRRAVPRKARPVTNSRGDFAELERLQKRIDAATALIKNGVGEVLVVAEEIRAGAVNLEKGLQFLRNSAERVVTALDGKK